MRFTLWAGAFEWITGHEALWLLMTAEYSLFFRLFPHFLVPN